MSELQELKDQFLRRFRELGDLVAILGRHAQRIQRFSNCIKVITITLSALSAAKGISDKIWGADTPTPLITFTLIGIVTTTLLGIEAAFKFEKRSSEIAMLATSCHTTLTSVDSEWQDIVESTTDTRTLDAGKKLVNSLNKKLADIHQHAVSLGINTSLLLLLGKLRESHPPSPTPSP